MTNIEIKLRPHHAAEMKRRLEEEIDVEDLGDILARHNYAPDTVLSVLSVYQHMRHNPQSRIEILPDEDISHDTICQNCHGTVRQNFTCDVPLSPGRVGKDGFESLRYDLDAGVITVTELLQKREAFGPHFRI
ncbi:hypothetical protein KKB64_01925 [Patescibacteria group bacterium]|nr:hypothetical protein [Patescibacteria group bacterium]MBU1472530.1 hypothetical protein [Patescibacteria group bacterium]MBU2460097.1 hypothetical protein [Patescibacteria group bacterium]MBU2544666.1 hypothetical protein [Patescibacteria group bacterium]